jgi:beta-phosphoglucomutase-like phosphatase (HAD superfamily)
MIRAFVFDLDGTLVETEELKALSYARAAAELRPDLEEGEEGCGTRSHGEVRCGYAHGPPCQNIVVKYVLQEDIFLFASVEATVRFKASSCSR